MPLAWGWSARQSLEAIANSGLFPELAILRQESHAWLALVGLTGQFSQSVNVRPRTVTFVGEPVLLTPALVPVGVLSAFAPTAFWV